MKYKLIVVIQFSATNPVSKEQQPPCQLSLGKVYYMKIIMINV